MGGQAVNPFSGELVERMATDSVVMGIKSYEFDIVEGQSWINVRIYDPLTKKLVLDLLEEAVRVSTKHKRCGLLMDVRGAPSLKTTVEDYDIAYYRLQELGYKQCLKSAIVVDPEDNSHDFLETCVMNAGYNWRIFSDADLADLWLRSASPSL